MTPKPDLDAIERRLNAATPGPWEVDDRVRCMAVVSLSRVDLPGLGHDYSGVVAFWSGPSSFGDPAGSWSDERRARIESDADLIAHAPEDLRTLVAEVRRLSAGGSHLLPSQRAALDRAGAPVVSPEGAPVSDGWRAAWAADEVVRLRRVLTGVATTVPDETLRAHEPAPCPGCTGDLAGLVDAVCPTCRAALTVAFAPGEVPRG